MCDYDINQSENSSGTDYVPETPVKKRVVSLTQVTSKRETPRKRRSKKQSQVSERDNGSQESN